MGDSNIAAQVAEFFTERGLDPVVTASGPALKVHASRPGTNHAICPNAYGKPMRPAGAADLELPPCRGCTREHVRGRQIAAGVIISRGTRRGVQP